MNILEVFFVYGWGLRDFVSVVNISSGAPLFCDLRVVQRGIVSSGLPGTGSPGREYAIGHNHFASSILSSPSEPD